MSVEHVPHNKWKQDEGLAHQSVYTIKFVTGLYTFEKAGRFIYLGFLIYTKNNHDLEHERRITLATYKRILSTI